ncbi:MAG: acyl-CoA desaturase [Hahellaceae bacterium]|nr:acyl-CoA desaturase [Hahellaceae bacterium]MCP5212540.1 acyl-CoA desaturase [Hahellaceae bacterium]
MKKLTEEQLASFEQEITAIRDAEAADLGQKDADYIRRVILVQRVAEIVGRIMLVLGFIHPVFWLLGVLSLAASKILDNMEIGHNILHGQYDWMNDPHLNSRKFEWDIACDAGSWKRVHNYEHHTYTNIVGKDRDFGYGLLRLSNDFAWRVKNLWQVGTYMLLSLLFEWGIAYHELAGERVFTRKKKKEGRKGFVTDEQLKKAFFGKAGRQIFKDYIFFPIIAGPMFFSVLLGNFIANLIRNLWTSTIIFCGHFTDGIHTFTEEECAGESRGQWYYRQMLGSSNLEAKRWFHIMTGHLSCQIEHHLFPDIPAHRYVNMAPKVAAVAEKYGIPYNTGRFSTQYLSVLKRIIKYSFPVREASQGASLSSAR